MFAPSWAAGVELAGPCLRAAAACICKPPLALCGWLFPARDGELDVEGRLDVCKGACRALPLVCCALAFFRG